MSRQTQTTIAVSLPEDVIDHILGFVPIDPLQSCSLVSRSWLPLAQRRLFHEVNVSVTSPAITSQTFQGLRRLFSTTSPHLARYIRHISLKVILPRDLWRTSDAQQLCLFLRHLERLGSARMVFHSCCWIPDLVHCLQKLVSQPTFESLFLTFVGKSVVGDHAPETDILKHCSFVRHLDLDIRSRLQGLRVFKGPPSTVTLPGLQTLNLRFLYPETYILYTPKLQALSFRIFFSTSHELDTATWSLIPRVPLSVTKLTLELVVDTPRSSSDEFPSFGDYTNNVEHLTLIAKLNPIAQTRVLNAVDSLFSTARLKNLLGLRTISLKFHSPCDFDIALRNLRPYAAWASLDAHLNALLCSGCLESLFFDLQFSDRLGDPPLKSQRDRSQKMSEFMEDCLPHISRSGIISVKVVESF